MTEVLMPRLSDTMEEGTLSRWLTHEGAPVHKGDAIAEIETDKAVMELEAYDEGPLTRILVAEGTTVPIGTPLAIVGTEPQAPPDQAAPEQARQTAAPAPALPAGPTEGPAEPPTPAGDEHEVRTSPWPAHWPASTASTSPPSPAAAPAGVSSARTWTTPSPGTADNQAPSGPPPHPTPPSPPDRPAHTRCPPRRPMTTRKCP